MRWIRPTARSATGSTSRGSDARAEQEGDGLLVEAQTEFQIKQVLDILYQKMSKRGVDVASLEAGEVEEGGGRARQRITVRQGIDKELAKKLVKNVKESKLKVQAAVQGEQVRVTGKKRDDLQQIIAHLRGGDFGLPLQFTNFRD